MSESRFVSDASPNDGATKTRREAAGADALPRFATDAGDRGEEAAAQPPRALYMEMQPAYKSLPGIPKRVVDTLSHVLTTQLSASLRRCLSETIFSSIEGQLSTKLADELPPLVARAAVTPLTLALHESIRGALVPTLGRALTAELARVLPEALVESLTRSVAHSVTQAIAATVAHTAAGVESEACAHCLHTAAGGGSCDALCWSSPEAHAAGDAAARGAHAAAAFFSDYYSPRRSAAAAQGEKKAGA